TALPARPAPARRPHPRPPPAPPPRPARARLGPPPQGGTAPRRRRLPPGPAPGSVRRQAGPARAARVAANPSAPVLLGQLALDGPDVASCADRAEVARPAALLGGRPPQRHPVVGGGAAG